MRISRKIHRKEENYAVQENEKDMGGNAFNSVKSGSLLLIVGSV